MDTGRFIYTVSAEVQFTDQDIKYLVKSAKSLPYPVGPASLLRDGLLACIQKKMPAGNLAIKLELSRENVAELCEITSDYADTGDLCDLDYKLISLRDAMDCEHDRINNRIKI
jgi:hypothetical protein